MSLSSCSENDKNTASQYVVQASVYLTDEGSIAKASVQDEFENLVSDPIITINDRPFDLHFLEDQLWGEAGEGRGNVSYFYLEMPDLKGGAALFDLLKG